MMFSVIEKKFYYILGVPGILVPLKFNSINYKL